MKQRCIFVGAPRVAVIAGVAALALTASSGAEVKSRTPAVTAVGQPAKAPAKADAAKELAALRLPQGGPEVPA